MTAVEWLVNRINKDFENNDFLISYANEIEQAKEIEKQQIIDAYGVKVNHSIKQGTTVYSQTFGEQYYKETFNK